MRPILAPFAGAAFLAAAAAMGSDRIVFRYVPGEGGQVARFRPPPFLRERAYGYFDGREAWKSGEPISLQGTDGRSSFTVEATVFPTSSEGDRVIVSNLEPHAGFAFGIRSGRLSGIARVSNAAGLAFTIRASGAEVTRNAWHRVAMRAVQALNFVEIQLFLDGRLVGSAKNVGRTKLNPSRTPAQVGGAGSPGGMISPLEGYIGHVTVWRDAVSVGGYLTQPLFSNDDHAYFGAPSAGGDPEPELDATIASSGLESRISRRQLTPFLRDGYLPRGVFRAKGATYLALEPSGAGGKEESRPALVVRLDDSGELNQVYALFEPGSGETPLTAIGGGIAVVDDLLYVASGAKGKSKGISAFALPPERRDVVFRFVNSTWLSYNLHEFTSAPPVPRAMPPLIRLYRDRSPLAPVIRPAPENGAGFTALSLGEDHSTRNVLWAAGEAIAGYRLESAYAISEEPTYGFRLPPELRNPRGVAVRTARRDGYVFYLIDGKRGEPARIHRLEYSGAEDKGLPKVTEVATAPASIEGLTFDPWTVLLWTASGGRSYPFVAAFAEAPVR